MKALEGVGSIQNIKHEEFPDRVSSAHTTAAAKRQRTDGLKDDIRRLRNIKRKTGGLIVAMAKAPDVYEEGKATRAPKNEAILKSRTAKTQILSQQFVPSPGILQPGGPSQKSVATDRLQIL